jgi:hypothetical protein
LDDESEKAANLSAENKVGGQSHFSARRCSSDRGVLADDRLTSARGFARCVWRSREKEPPREISEELRGALEAAIFLGTRA